MIKIRLRKSGIKKKPIFYIIIADSKSPRDGKFIEKIGYYIPGIKKKIYINLYKLNLWKNLGAKLTNVVKKLIKNFKLL